MALYPIGAASLPSGDLERPASNTATAPAATPVRAANSYHRARPVTPRTHLTTIVLVHETWASPAPAASMVSVRDEPLRKILGATLYHPLAASTAESRRSTATRKLLGGRTHESSRRCERALGRVSSQRAVAFRIAMDGTVSTASPVAFAGPARFVEDLHGGALYLKRIGMLLANRLLSGVVPTLARH